MKAWQELDADQRFCLAQFRPVVVCTFCPPAHRPAAALAPRIAVAQRYADFHTFARKNALLKLVVLLLNASLV